MWVESDEGSWSWWDDCAVEGCPHGVCKRLRSKYCYPHTQYTGLAVMSAIVHAVDDKPASSTVLRVQVETVGDNR